MRELEFVTIFPDDPYFTWQVHAWLESLKNLGLSEKATVLIFTPNFRERSDKYQKIIDLYPEVNFKFYKDEHNMSRLMGIYIPILRPYTAWRYWTDHPEMKDKAVFYCDSDILFTETFNINRFLDDDVDYMSDTNSYINASYFDSKVKDVLPEKLEEYKKIDVLSEATKIIGIDRETCEKNNKHSGGTQYLLKNIDSSFWKKMMNDCIPLIQYLGRINKEFFPNEEKGYQKWTSDMWALLWNLWLKGHETKVVPELNFAWVHDPIAKLNECGIYHNAGATDEFTVYGKDKDGKDKKYPVFYKGKYHSGTNPMIDSHLDDILNHEESKKHCTWYYASKLDELRKKYNLKY